jgi:hypothetical protein
MIIEDPINDIWYKDGDGVLHPAWDVIDEIDIVRLEQSVYPSWHQFKYHTNLIVHLGLDDKLDKFFPWNDSRYGLEITIKADPSQFNPGLGNNWTEFYLVTKDTNTQFYNNWTPTMYWDGFNWTTAIVNLPMNETTAYLPSPSPYTYTKNSFIGIPTAVYQFNDLDIWRTQWRGVLYFNESGDTVYYDWFKGVDRTSTINELPLPNIVILVSLAVFPLAIIIDRVFHSLESSSTKRNRPRKKKKGR